MKIRPGDVSDFDFLVQMLFEACHWNPQAERPSNVERGEDFVGTKMFADWGRVGDRAVIAEEGEMKLGAAWYRLWTEEEHSYGFVDAETPELGIAVVAARRSRGIGRALLQELLATARADGFSAISLSVDPHNYARSLYESLGFTKVGESGTSWTLLMRLDSMKCS